MESVAIRGKTKEKPRQKRGQMLPALLLRGLTACAA